MLEIQFGSSSVLDLRKLNIKFLDAIRNFLNEIRP